MNFRVWRIYNHKIGVIVILEMIYYSANPFCITSSHSLVPKMSQIIMEPDIISYFIPCSYRQKFLSVRTWDKVRDYIRFHDDLGHLWDERMRRCDTERVGRVVNHFQNDDNAYFMVINAPNTEVHLITGEIGICSLLTGQRGHFELPRVSYQTSKGNVVLFPDEIMPVDINLLQQEINEGYIMLSDGRYLPPKEAVQQCYNAFGIRVGLGDNWEDIYDGWNKEMK